MGKCRTRPTPFARRHGRMRGAGRATYGVRDRRVVRLVHVERATLARGDGVSDNVPAVSPGDRVSATREDAGARIIASRTARWRAVGPESVRAPWLLSASCSTLRWVFPTASRSPSGHCYTSSRHDDVCAGRPLCFAPTRPSRRSRRRHGDGCRETAANPF